MNSEQPEMTSTQSHIEVANLQYLCAGMVIATVAWMAYVILGTDALGDMHQPVVSTWTIFGAGFAGMAFLLRMFIRNMMEISASNKPGDGEDDLPADRNQLFSIYQRQFGVSLLLLTSAAFLNIDAPFYDHNWVSLGVSSILIIGMVNMFPTSTEVENWIEKRMQRDP